MSALTDRMLAEWEAAIRAHANTGTTEAQAQWARNWARIAIEQIRERSPGGAASGTGETP